MNTDPLYGWPPYERTSPMTRLMSMRTLWQAPKKSLIRLAHWLRLDVRGLTRGEVVNEVAKAETRLYLQSEAMPWDAEEL